MALRQPPPLPPTRIEIASAHAGAEWCGKSPQPMIIVVQRIAALVITGFHGTLLNCAKFQGVKFHRVVFAGAAIQVRTGPATRAKRVRETQILQSL